MVNKICFSQKLHDNISIINIIFQYGFHIHIFLVSPKYINNRLSLINEIVTVKKDMLQSHSTAITTVYWVTSLNSWNEMNVFDTVDSKSC